MCLSAYLKAELGERIQIELLDLRMCRSPAQALKTCLKRLTPRLIGISMQVYEQPFLADYLGIIKAGAPGADILVGGPFATYYYDMFLDDRRIAAAVIGEGEQVLLNIVKRMLDGKDYLDVNGIARNDGRQIICNPREAYLPDLNALPLPDYSLIDFEEYWRDHVSMNMVLADPKYVQVIGSRACPYNCIYCHGIFGKKLRQRSPEHVLAELQMLHSRYGLREFHFVDDLFNFDRARMHRLFRLIIQTGLDVKIAFPNGLRADQLEFEDLDLMRAAGVYMVTFAVESGSPRVQKLIRKNLNIGKVMENVIYANRIGLITKGFFMLGFPGETSDEIQQTIRLALDSDFDLISIFKVIPFYRTELFEMAQAVYPGMERNTYSNYIAKRSFYEDVTGLNLNPLLKRTYFRFYSPLRLARLYRKLPMKKYFTRYFLHAAREVLKT